MNKLKNNIISAHEVNYEGKLTLLKEDNNNLKCEIMKLKKELMIKSNEIDEIKNKNKSLLNQISENEKIIKIKENELLENDSLNQNKLLE